MQRERDQDDEHDNGSRRAQQDPGGKREALGPGVEDAEHDEPWREPERQRPRRQRCVRCPVPGHDEDRDQEQPVACTFEKRASQNPPAIDRRADAESADAQ